MPYRAATARERIPNMPKQLYNEPSPLETRVVSKRFGLENSESLDTYLANDGFKAFLKARGVLLPEQVVEKDAHHV